MQLGYNSNLRAMGLAWDRYNTISHPLLWYWSVVDWNLKMLMKNLAEESVRLARSQAVCRRQTTREFEERSEDDN